MGHRAGSARPDRPGTGSRAGSAPPGTAKKKERNVGIAGSAAVKTNKEYQVAYRHVQTVRQTASFVCQCSGFAVDKRPCQREVVTSLCASMSASDERPMFMLL